MAIKFQNCTLSAPGGAEPFRKFEGGGRVFFLRRANVPVKIVFDEEAGIVAGAGLLIVRDKPFASVSFTSLQTNYSAYLEFYAGNEPINQIAVQEGNGLSTFPWVITGTLANGASITFDHSGDRPYAGQGNLPYRKKSVEITNLTSGRALTVSFYYFNGVTSDYGDGATVFGASSRAFEREENYRLTNTSGATINYQILESYYFAP